MLSADRMIGPFRLDDLAVTGESYGDLPKTYFFQTLERVLSSAIVQQLAALLQYSLLVKDLLNFKTPYS